MKKYLLAIAASVILSQVAFAETTENKPTAITCPDISVLQPQTLLSVSTSSSIVPARFDGRFSPVSVNYESNYNGYPYTSSTAWTPSINGIKATDAVEASQKIKTILAHLANKGILKPEGDNRFVCEYTIDSTDLADYAEGETKPTVTASANLYIGNYLFAK